MISWHPKLQWEKLTKKLYNIVKNTNYCYLMNKEKLSFWITYVKLTKMSHFPWTSTSELNVASKKCVKMFEKMKRMKGHVYVLHDNVT